MKDRLEKNMELLDARIARISLKSTNQVDSGLGDSTAEKEISTLTPQAMS